MHMSRIQCVYVYTEMIYILNSVARLVYICNTFVCAQMKINDEICAVLIEILTMLLKEELMEGYAVESSSDV